MKEVKAIMRKSTTASCLCLFLLLLATGLRSSVGASGPEPLEFVPGEVIVAFEEATGESFEALEAKGGTVIKEISVLNALVVEVTVGMEDEYIQRVSSIVGVRYAERNGIYQASYTPNDAYWIQLWNMRIIEADDAWDVEKGSAAVVIAIVDSGVDYLHPDLAANYVVGGYDWVNDDNDPMDDHSHGTHCAGIAAAVMDNKIGVAGVAQCSIWSEKVLNEFNRGSWDDLASAVTHATDNGVEIISMSLGGYGYSSLVDEACSYAWSNDVLLVAAAGNDNMNIDINSYYPACLETVIAVSATDDSDARWAGSNYGSAVEFAAPGVDVFSTKPPFGGDLYYTYKTGTSMACPHVSGVAALLLSQNPSLTNAELRERLHTAVDDLGTPGKDIYYGYGRINAYKALTVFQYHFQLAPYINVVHLNVNPGGWLNGYMTGIPMDWNPVLGKYEAGRFYLAIDVYPDETPGYYEMLFLVGTVATRTGQLIQTIDGMSYDGPLNVNLVPVAAQSEELEGPDATQASDAEVTPAAWYAFQMNPSIDIVHLNTNPGGWLNGYDETPEPDAPVLGFYEDDRFYFGVDGIHGAPITLLFIAGEVPTRDGDLIKTEDGTSYEGPEYIWLTPT
ncbi:MAG: peptidase S8 [Candidatus Bathyarchaeota archaeon]|nr:MAG: peptidase S8 [Candidatus Bathyarchaeota archaeon]